jgi:hypothetical protein
LVQPCSTLSSDKKFLHIRSWIFPGAVFLLLTGFGIRLISKKESQFELEKFNKKKGKLMTEIGRKMLALKSLPPDCIGYDYDGKEIKEGDSVVVVQEDNQRKGVPGYEFCSVGKVGIASRHFMFPAGWVVLVTFDGGRLVGCTDHYVKIVA